MSILINMEMPKRCVDCKLKRDKHLPTACIFRDWQSLTVNDTPQTNEWCPLVPVPPHGRLIDADELHRLFENQWHYLQCLNWEENPKAEAMQTGVNWCINTMHDDAPIVIPADKDGET